MLAPVLVVGASLIGRRHGPRAAGLVGSLPIVAGPVLLVLAIEQGEAFAADAAAGTLLALVAVVAFLLTRAGASARRGAVISVAVAWSVFLGVAVLVSSVSPGPWLAAGCGGAALAAAALMLPRGTVSGAAPRPPSWDLPLRAAAAATLVLVVTALAEAAGPRLSGALALSPIAISVLSGFSLATQGRASTLVLLRGLVTGLPAVVCFFTIVALTIQPWGTAVSFVTASVAALALQAVVAHATGPGDAAARTAAPPGTGESHPTHSA